MKYIKTFENYDSDQESQNPEDVVVDVNLKSQEDMVAKIAREKGLNAEEVANIYDELLQEPKTTNEEEEPFTLVSAACMVLGPLLIGGSGLLYSKIAKNKGLKRYVMYQAEQKVKDMINYMFAEDNTKYLQEFFNYTAELDRLRDQDLFVYVPELKPFKGE